MRNFTKAENDRVDFLIEEIKLLETVSRTPLLKEYLNELLEYVILKHPRAEKFYCYGGE